MTFVHQCQIIQSCEIILGFGICCIQLLPTKSSNILICLYVLLSYLKFPTHFWHFAERSWATDSNKMWNYVTTDKLCLEIHKIINTGHLIKSTPHWVLWKGIHVPNNQISIDLYWKSIWFHLLMAIGYHCWNNRSNKTKN